MKRRWLFAFLAFILISLFVFLNFRKNDSWVLFDDLKEKVLLSGNGALNNYNGRVTYVGVNPDNYLYFDGAYYRIISIEPDGTYKIIKNESIGSMEFKEASWESSSLKKYLNDDWYPSISADDRKRVSENHDFNVGDLTIVSGQGRENDFQMESSRIWKGNIGLISPSDYIFTSGNDECRNSGIYHYNNSACFEEKVSVGSKKYYNNWLFPLNTMLTMNRNFTGNWYVSSSGTLENSDDSSFDIFPVLYVKGSCQTGSGTKSDPYKLKNLLTVHHNYSDKTEDVNICLSDGEEYETTAQTKGMYKVSKITGSDKVDLSKGTSFGVIDNDTEVNYYYSKKKGKVITRYYEENSNKSLMSSISKTYDYGDNYSTSPTSITGYEVSRTPNNASSEVNQDKIYVTYYYRKKKYTVITHHYEENSTKEISRISFKTYDYGSSYSTSPLKLNGKLSGYKLISIPSNAGGDIDGDVIVNYYYKLKDVKLTVHHYLEGTSNELVQDEVISKKYGDSYTTAPSEYLSNYEVVSSSRNTSGVINKNTEVTYYYKKKTVNLTVKHLDYNTKKSLSKEVSSSVISGDVYETVSDTPSGYVLKEKSDNYRGVARENDIEVIYYYEKDNFKVSSSTTSKETSEINHIDDLISYNLNYDFKVKEDIGGFFTVNIVSKLPFPIDTTRSDLAGGIYDSSNLTITWDFQLVGSAGSVKNITKDLKILFLDIDVNKNKLTNVFDVSVNAFEDTYEFKDVHTTDVNITGNATVRYLEEETDRPLSRDVSYTGLTGTAFSPIAKSISGYKLVSNNKDSYKYTGNNQVINYYYKKCNVLLNTSSDNGTADYDESGIHVLANSNYAIDKITINDKEIDVPYNSSYITISSFPDMNIDQEVNVSFIKTKKENNVITYSNNVYVVLIVMAIVAVIISAYVFKNNKVLRSNKTSTKKKVKSTKKTNS